MNVPALSPQGRSVSRPPHGLWQDLLPLPGLRLEQPAPYPALTAPNTASGGARDLRVYHVRCRSDLHAACTQVAERAGTSVGQLTRAALALLTPEHLHSLADPGPPLPADGRRIGRRLLTPMLRLRLPRGLTAEDIRKALGFMVGLRSGGHVVVPRRGVRELEQRAADQSEALARLRQGLAVLAFEPLEAGVRSVSDAKHVMRFPPGSTPDADAVNARFKAMAALLHPDAGLVDHHTHMAQLIEARRILRGK